MIKRILALLLSFVMVLSTVPAQAFAEETAEETLAPAETEAVEETSVPEEPAEEPLTPEEETLAPEAPAQEAVVEETEPSFDTELQPRSASGDCSAEDSWNSANDVS